MSYLSGLLDTYAVPSGVEDVFRTNRERIEGVLTGNWATGNPRFYYGGSFIKRTMISADYDLDLVVYFAPTDRFTVRQFYESVEQRLKQYGYIAHRHNVAIRLPYEGFHIDVVPGRAIDNTYRYANLYASERNTTKQTSLKVHIDLVRDGENHDAIKILKLWRRCHGVPLRSFVLELAIREALFNHRDTDLGDRVWKFLGWLHTSFAGARLVDPANSNNVISDDISAGDKQAIVAAAARSRAQQNWQQIVW
ncbi:MAG: hypothetical protein M3463_20760 [Verrucomicrobiota bacterium]|nr:hypothetical protein [Verrucomicrobiota bacterium]